jgi:hypothetical protein
MNGLLTFMVIKGDEQSAFKFYIWKVFLLGQILLGNLRDCSNDVLRRQNISPSLMPPSTQSHQPFQKIIKHEGMIPIKIIHKIPTS